MLKCSSAERDGGMVKLEVQTDRKKSSVTR